MQPTLTTLATLTRDPISLILPFLTLSEFATSAVAISRVWYLTAQKMRSRRDEYTLKYIDERRNYLQMQHQHQHQHHSLLCSSSLRHHVTNLTLQLFEHIIEIQSQSQSQHQHQHQPQSQTDAISNITATAAVQQLEWLNAIGASMSHLQSLTVKFVLTPVDTGDAQISGVPIPIHFPPNLLCLKIETIMMTGTRLSIRFEKWIVPLFSAITSTDSLCSSLRILESKVVNRGLIAHPKSVVLSTSMYKLISLRRFVLKSLGSDPRSSISFHDSAIIDAVRAIPQLMEIQGIARTHYQYFLRSPSKHSYRRLGVCAISLLGQSGIYFGQSDSDHDQSSVLVVHPDQLVASSGHSLIELNASIQMSPSFLPRFIQLRYLNLNCHPERTRPVLGEPRTILVETFSSEDLVSALSQCRTLERLLINWTMTKSELSESHIERIVTPLARLDYLSLTGSHQIRSLAFMLRAPHLINNLRYFIFIGHHVTSLSEYRSIYPLSQLRLLCIEHEWSQNEIAIWKSESGVTQVVLDRMFRPRTQLRASYSDQPRSQPEMKGPGQLPHEYCPQLQHFIQHASEIYRLKEWQDVVDEAEREREAELLTIP